MSEALAIERELLLGDEALALGAIHAGISGAYAYPGTPSTEILEYIIKQNDPTISARWAVNEKTSYEEALGVSYAGKRVLVSMKHVGLNVAADPFMNSAVTGVKGGLVVVVADDPGMHSSQNEQDSRYYAKFGLIPCLEPATQQHAYDMVRDAFDLSEALSLPVMIRVVTRLAHSRAAVVTREPRPQNDLDPSSGTNWVLLPVNARKGYQVLVDKQPGVIERLDSLETVRRAGAESGKTGLIATGIAGNYVRECFGGEDDLPPTLFVTGYPMPEPVVDAFLDDVEEVIAIEDGYPLVEEMLRGLPSKNRMPVHGRLDGTLPRTGELNPDLVAAALSDSGIDAPGGDFPLAPRPPALCSGCPHIVTYEVLNQVLAEMDGSRVFSDIGCYTLGALPPYNSIHSCVDMGASITMAIGAARAGLRPAIAVIGDSTFMHSGMTGLIDAINEDTPVTVIIVDNSTVGMTGGQPTAATGDKLYDIVKGLGVPDEHVVRLDPVPKKRDQIAKAMEKAFAHEGLSVLIPERACIQEVKRIAKAKREARG
jgi:indolepyruvate ferredoxin oxidoreductase alpha subunit